MKPAVLITGAARGIGKACAERFAREGWAVAVVDINGEAAREAADAISAAGGQALAITADVRKADQVEGAVSRTVETFGGLTALVNNAGIIQPQPSAEVSEEEWDRMLNVHLKGAFLFCRTAYPHLRQTPNAAIVSVASISAVVGVPGRLTYCVAKAGLSSLTRVLAVEWAGDGIRVNAVAPGWTETVLVRDAIEAGVVDARHLQARVPLARLAQEEEIASVIHFLATPASSFITGQTILADGGFSIDGRVSAAFSGQSG